MLPPSALIAAVIERIDVSESESEDKEETDTEETEGERGGRELKRDIFFKKVFFLFWRAFSKIK